MKRQIIKINEDKCNGCGLCVPNCPEGALQIIDGKARLVGELLCDGLGACIGNCPENAISIEDREAVAYDERKVIANIVEAGDAVLTAHIKHLRDHRQSEYLNIALQYLKDNNIPVPELEVPEDSLACGCPGSMTKDFRSSENQNASPDPVPSVRSQLRQWPVQLHLLNPRAPYFQDADLLIAADCTAFSYGDFHQRFLKDKTLIMFCPKLDNGIDIYLEKLTSILKENSIRSITVVKMQVPCCTGALNLTEQALKQSGKNIVIKEYTISIQGEIV